MQARGAIDASAIWKRQSLCVVPSSYEEIESDNAGLRPRKWRNTVSVAKLLGGIGDVHGNKFSVPLKKEKVVVPSSTMTPPPLFTSALLIDFGSGSMFGDVMGSPRGSS